MAKVTWAHITGNSLGISNKPPGHHLSPGMQLSDHSPFITAQTKPLVLVSHNTTGPIFANVGQLCDVTEASLPWCISMGFLWMPLLWGCRIWSICPTGRMPRVIFPWTSWRTGNNLANLLYGWDPDRERDAPPGFPLKRRLTALLHRGSSDCL